MIVAPSNYEECRKNLDELIKWNNGRNGDRNEAMTRLQLIDRLFFDCLGWSMHDHTELESEYMKEYADYLFRTEKDILIVEAKREGNYFELPAGKKRDKYKISSLIKDNTQLKDAITQASGYCQKRGVPFGVVSNGHQIVAFIASRSDGVPPLEGTALVFSSLEDMSYRFLDLWQSLSRSGVQENRLYNTLVQNNSPDVPAKLSSSIHNYPGIKNRNSFQTDLKILTELVIEDVARSPEIENEFLRECYCQSNALSQYAQVSRDILSARYASLFDESSPGPDIHPITTTKGLTPDFLDASMTRRPIILIGDVGVGKTMFQRNLILVDAANVFQKAISIYVNFGSQATLSPDLQTFLLSEIERQLLEKYNIDIQESSFVNAVYDLDIQRFNKSSFGDLIKTNPKLYEEKKFSKIESWLENKSEHLQRSLVHISKGRQRQIVVFLDNADQRDYSFQEQVFLVAQEISASWSAMVFMPIRPETFHRSKKKDALSGYHAKAFSIGPPRIDLVVEKRLKFALKIAEGKIPYSFNNRQFNVKANAIASLIRIFLKSSQENSDLLELLENISNGNVRVALDLIQQFFGSGHVDTEKIYNIFQREGSYIIPIHEFIRGVLYGDGVYFAPERTPFVNLFDINLPDSKEYFVLPLLIGSVHSLKNTGAAEGFVDIGVVYDRLQKLGFTPNQIEHAVIRGCKLQLIEAPARRIPDNINDLPKSLRVTIAGVYHIQTLCRMFSYYDAIIVDIPVLDQDTRQKIKIVSTLEDRIARVEIIRSYFDRCFSEVQSNDFFNWKQISIDLQSDIDKVRLSAKKKWDNLR